jgi:hypothetical protein
MSEINTDDAPRTASSKDLMTALRDSAFGGNTDEMAIALGRPNEEVAGWLDGSLPVDEDGLIKAHGLAEERGLCKPSA